MNVSAIMLPTKGYVLNGTVKGVKDGEKVFLSTYTYGSLSGQGFTLKIINLDSAFIRNGRFIIKGYVKEPKLCMMLCKRNNKDIVKFPIVLENADFTMSFDAINKLNDKVTGSKNTDLFVEYAKGFNEILVKKLSNEKSKNATAAHNDIVRAPAERNAAREAIKEQKKYIARFICDHIPSWVSGYLLRAFYGNFDQVTKDSVKAIIKVKWPDNEFMKNQIAQDEYEQEKQLIQNQTPVGSDYKDLAMKDTLGMPMKISDYVPKNKVTLVDFWASWCGPCRSEIPNIIKLYNQYKDKGFGVVCVSFDDNAKAWKGAINALHLPWPQMSDLKGWKSEGAKVYGIMSIPYTLLIDQNGKILAKWLRSEELATKLSEILK